MSTLSQRLTTVTGTLMLSAVLLAGTGSIAREAIASKERSEHHEREEHESGLYKEGYSQRRNGRFAPAETSAMYQEECSACHLAYPPALLPARSWQLIMTTLDDHFGEDASLDAETSKAISNYLVKHAAGWNSKLLRKISDSDTPTRITELPYFVRKHDEIPKRLVADNPEVGSFSNCDSCHRDAARGDIDEDTVDIPGYGRWDD